MKNPVFLSSLINLGRTISAVDQMILQWRLAQRTESAVTQAEYFQALALTIRTHHDTYAVFRQLAIGNGPTRAPGVILPYRECGDGEFVFVGEGPQTQEALDHLTSMKWLIKKGLAQSAVCDGPEQWYFLTAFGRELQSYFEREAQQEG